MQNSELSSFVEQSKQNGFSETQIRESLQKAGWDQQAIESVFEDKDKTLVAPPPPKSLSPHSMWDAFEHILLFISLYVMATSIALILHYFVDKWFPTVSLDKLYVSSVESFQLTLLRWYVSALVVSFPLFAFFFLDITKRSIQNTAIRSLKSRKFLIYLTLVITFIILISNIIGLIYSFLNGNITVNFVLHFIVTILVSGIVFGYYFYQVKGDRKLYA
ncbi:hypothetical protein HGA88_01085 [Candidatus Roizmanbacteria bacterium]|nr:hypothetical protein [Candidatus Roizmanbacteria bacterium]